MKKTLVILLVILAFAFHLAAAPSVERYMAPSAQYGSSDAAQSA